MPSSHWTPEFFDAIHWPDGHWIGEGGVAAPGAGWQTLAVNQQAAAGYGTDYPFLRKPGAARWILGDLWLAYDDPSSSAGGAFTLPLRVAWLQGFGDGPPSSFYAATVTFDEPLSYWRMGDANDVTVFVDEMENQDLGVVEPATMEQPGAIAGDANTSTMFSGGGKAEYSVPAANLFAATFTLEAWFKTSAVFAGIFTMYLHKWIYLDGDGHLQAGIQDETFNDHTFTTTGASLADGQWHHVVFTFDRPQARLYVDGMLAASTTIDADPNPEPPVVNVALGWSNSGVLTGWIDEAAIYSTALSAARVAAHYAAAIDGAVPTHARDILIVDADDRVVFDSTLAAEFSESAWGVNLTTAQWSNGQQVLRVTYHDNPPPWAPVGSLLPSNAVLSETEGVLDPRAYYRMPRRLRSIKVGDTVLPAGDVVFAEGYNIRLTASETTSSDGGRRSTQIAVRARPGDGLGRTGGCDEDVDPPIRTLAGVRGTDAGDFLLDAVGCYRVQRPSVTTSGPGDQRTATVTPHALEIGNDCGPCCECDDFVTTYRGVLKLDQRYRELAARAEIVRDTLADNIARWNAQKACRAAAPLRLLLQPEPRCRLVVAGLHCNSGGCCTGPVVLRTTFEAFRDGAPLDLTGDVSLRCDESVRAGADTRYDEVAYTPAGAWPVFDHMFDAADPDGVSRFRNRVALAGCDEADAIRVTLSIHAPQAFDEDGNPCQMTAPESVVVPAEVAAIWVGDPPPYPVRAVMTRTVPVGPAAGCGGCA